jgi:hypothetical protein
MLLAASDAFAGIDNVRRNRLDEMVYHLFSDARTAMSLALFHAAPHRAHAVTAA